jgi:hypothetical protein
LEGHEKAGDILVLCLSLKIGHNRGNDFLPYETPLLPRGGSAGDETLARTGYIAAATIASLTSLANNEQFSRVFAPWHKLDFAL